MVLGDEKLRKKTMLLVSFLLMLYIGPSIFIVSYASPATPTETNMTKDFSVSDSGSGWYDENWHYRQSILIYVDTQVGLYWQVRIPVTYNSHMQTDFDDIRFAEWSGSVLEDYWRESYIASTSAVFWVKVAEELDANYTIYMYYGNDAVSSASNGTDTFLFYEDWSSQSIDAWTVAAGQQDGQTTFSVTDATQGGYVAKIEGDPADSYLIYSDYTRMASFATMFRSNLEETTTGNIARMGSGWAGAYGWAFLQGSSGTETFQVVDDDANPDPQAMDATYYDVWTIFQITRDKTYAKLYANTALIETASFAPDVNNNPVISIQNQDSEDDIYSDWVAVRRFVEGQPIFDSFGDEENNFIWQIVGSAELVFVVAIDETGLNMFLIIFGLVLVPLSSMYLVKGGKSEMSTNKLFFGLIIFLMGWGLFLGGIFG